MIVLPNPLQLTMNPGVDDIDLVCPAWAFTSLVAFLRPSPWTTVNRRLSNGEMDVYGAVVSGPVRIQAPFTIIGEVDRHGDPYDSPTAGLISNLHWLINNVFLPSDPPATVKLWLPGYPELDRTGQIQFEDVPTDTGFAGAQIDTTITVVLPTGLTT